MYIKNTSVFISQESRAGYRTGRTLFSESLSNPPPLSAESRKPLPELVSTVCMYVCMYRLVVYSIVFQVRKQPSERKAATTPVYCPGLSPWYPHIHTYNATMLPIHTSILMSVSYIHVMYRLLRWRAWWPWYWPTI